MATILRMALGRLLLLVPMVLGVTLLVFVVLRFSPSDPAYNALGEGSTPEARAAYAAELGLNDPLPVRYARFLGDLVRGDLGVTAAPSRPVTEAVSTAFPLTLQLAVLSVVLGVLVALALGVTAALFRDRWPDQVIRALSMAGVAMPSFWLGILLIQQFALRLGWFPTGGYVNPADSVGEWLRSLALPAVAVALPVGSQLARVVRTAMVEELDRDYVRTAIGGGLPRSVVVGRNVLRNALITPMTVLGLQIGYLLSGTVVIEAIFGLPGLGTLIMQAVTAGDLALVQGVVLCVAVSFLLVNLLVDVLYLFANPRLKGAAR
ncbi:ABC transporter permease [Actinomadura sp. WMMB 499]|uniref:ABC transporter permease n=1 Tax=Actinomadura sp. WMMB 499 TaxID=1219491 RepID=UPI0012444A44|nr:ABC transporter permease [Actinomadura sp. WMMB 499]QFG22785.1 ABC transporter permease [Actinomadura sp. WMMB 499]